MFTASLNRFCYLPSKDALALKNTSVLNVKQASKGQFQVSPNIPESHKNWAFGVVSLMSVPDENDDGRH